MSGLKGNQKRGTSGKFEPNPTRKPARSLKNMASSNTPPKVDFREQDAIYMEHLNQPDNDLLDCYRAAKANKDINPNRHLGLESLAQDRGLVDSDGNIYTDPDYTPKYRTGTDINIAGTYLQGYVGNITYTELKDTFGEPEHLGDLSDGKIQVEWRIEFETPDGRMVASIYDWKTEGNPEYTTEWNIGGKVPEAHAYVLKALGRTS